MRKSAGMALLASTLLVVSSGAGISQDKGTIKLGFTGAITGPFNEFGEGLRRGAEVAIEEWNEQGGVNGQKVELATVLDDQLVPDRAVQNMRRILDDRSISALIAPSGSGPTLAVIDMMVSDGRPVCNAQAQTPTIVYPNGADKPPRPNVFSVAMSSMVEAEKLGQVLAASFKNVGIVHESTSYGQIGAELIKKNILAISSGATVSAESYNQRAQDMTAQVVRLQRAGAEVIVFVGLGADAAVLRKTMSRLGVNVPLYGSAGLVTVPFMEGVGDLAVGARAANAVTFGQRPLLPQVQKFLERYRKKYGTDRWYGPDPENPLISMAPVVAAAYDCTNLLLDGIKRAKSTEPAAVIKAIEETKNLPGVFVRSVTLSANNHAAFTPDDLGVYEMQKKGDQLLLQMISK